MLEMKVSGIVLDPQSRSPIVVLRDLDDRRALLIWIGPPEANAIMLVLEKIELSRPSTHDLMYNILKTLKTPLKSILINDMKDNTFYAQLNLKSNDDEKDIVIDARPSDAIALALRAKVPILVSEKVMLTSSIPINPSQDEEEAEKFKKFIDNIKPSDFLKMCKNIDTHIDEEKE